jgi:hypothetical protein
MTALTVSQSWTPEKSTPRVVPGGGAEPNGVPTRSWNAPPLACSKVAGTPSPMVEPVEPGGTAGVTVQNHVTSGAPSGVRATATRSVAGLALVGTSGSAPATTNIATRDSAPT